MSEAFAEALQYFSLPEFRPGWGRIRRGIEKESLRVTPESRLAQTPHPQALGSALTHPYITTDYSEALLELITPVFDDIDNCLDFLADLHRYVYGHLPDDELLWVASMPCFLESEKNIPLAQYGSSNIGRLKTLYREGLGHRYGRLMQTIAGIHYNFSMPESFWQDYRDLRSPGEDLQAFRTRSYLHLIRNFHRYSWLLLYLFGASPAVCRCFTRNRPHDLEPFNDTTLYKPHATCLRMGNLGYRSDAQGSIFICYNDLGNYIDSLGQAMSTPYAPYEKIGTKNGGQYLQMNTNLLQLENEFYASIRPKRTGPGGKRPLSLLLENGIEYIEVRALDLNPFLPVGIDAEQIRFLDSFLLFCLLSESPECTEAEYFQVADNLTLTVENGRDPALMLSRNGDRVRLRDWADELLQKTAHSAALLDGTHGTNKYSQALKAQQAKVLDAELTPSARILAGMKASNSGFSGFAMACSKEARSELTSDSLADEQRRTFTEASARSLQDQLDVEAADNMNFDEFLKSWNDYRVDASAAEQTM